MFDKNLKNPAAPSEAVGQSCLFRLSVPESELSHNSLNIHGDVTSLSRLAEKTSRFALKNIYFKTIRIREKDSWPCFLVERSGAVFLLTKYVMALEPKMRGGDFYLGVCSQGKMTPLILSGL